MSIEVSLPENKYQLFDSQKYVKRFYNLGNRQMFSLSQTSIKLYNHYLNLSWDFFFFLVIHSMQGWTANCEAWSYKKKKHNKITAYMKSV